MHGFYGAQDGLRWRGVCFDVTGAGTAVSGVAQAAASVAAASIQADAARDAAKIQTASANRSADLVNDRFKQTRDDFEPYRGDGIAASNLLMGDLGKYIDTTNPYSDEMKQATPQVPQAMSQQELESTPGYQFTLNQGLKATQSAAAARGLGVSGAALKGASTYATGLSDQTYNTRFNQQQALFSNQQTKFNDVQTRFTNDQGLLANSFNRLNGLVQTGQNSAAQTGQLGNAAANQAGSYLTAGANAAGAAALAGGNAAASGINGVANAFSQYNAQNALTGNTGSMYGSNNQAAQYGDYTQNNDGSYTTTAKGY